MPLHAGMLCWPDDPPLRLHDAASLANDGVRVTRIETGSHAGTHIDAPAHFLAGGSGVDAISLDVLVGPCRVLDLSAAGRGIDREALEAHRLRGGERLLLRTANEGLLRRTAFTAEYAALLRSAADYLVEVGVILVGIDYLSIELFESKGHPVHVTLLRAGVVIVEGLDLTDVKPGDYDLIALPLRLSGLDGSPARVLLRDRDASIRGRY